MPPTIALCDLCLEQRPVWPQTSARSQKQDKRGSNSCCCCLFFAFCFHISHPGLHQNGSSWQSAEVWNIWSIEALISGLGNRQKHTHLCRKQINQSRNVYLSVGMAFKSSLRPFLMCNKNNLLSSVHAQFLWPCSITTSHFHHVGVGSSPSLASGVSSRLLQSLVVHLRTQRCSKHPRNWSWFED